MSGPIDHLALHAKLDPARLAAIDLARGRRWSYGQLHRAVGACARLLLETYGCEPGDRVGCLSKNRVELIVLHLACARTGAIFVPLNWRLTPLELAALVEDADPKVLFGDAALQAAGIAGLDLDTLAEGIDAALPLAADAPAPPAGPSLILYTSGTSGRPKGALLTERNLGQTAINFGLLGRVTPTSAFLVDSPMFHVIGLVSSVRPALMLGAAILVSDGFQPARTLARIADPALRVSHYFCVPQMAAMLRAEPGFDPNRLKGLTAIFTGGAPNPANDIMAWLELGIPMVDGYGMSETGTVFGMSLDPAVIAAKAGGVGLPTPAVRARIVDGSDHDCAPGQPGELLLQGENVFSAYWRRPEETEASFTPDGWFRTGDIAICDPEGFYTLVDRKKDMFISGGENVYPAEIEAALASCPGLVEFAVVGVPDDKWGEVGTCIFVPQDGLDVSHHHLLDHLSSRLARYKIPRRFVVMERLPRTASGKILKGQLRAFLTAKTESRVCSSQNRVWE